MIVGTQHLQSREIMKASRVVLAAGFSFLVGTVAAFATPAVSTETSPAQCTHLSCAFHPDGVHVWCVYSPGSKCSLSNQGFLCEADWC